MRLLKLTLIATLVFGLNTSCFEDQDDNAISASEINDFVWKAMNAVYLYKAEIPDLANDRFSSNEEYGNYLNSFSAPEDLFESVVYQREVVDRFSIIVDDYIALEQQLSGVFRSNGLEFNFYLAPGSETNVIAVIRLVLNDSEASALGLQRGQIIDKVDGVGITTSNFQSLFGQVSYTLHFATYNDNGTPDDTADDSVNSTSETASLTKVPYTENPVYLTEIIEVNGENIGYLMYNSFNADFISQLNNAFETFQANNVQHLVLDLRYNGGGRVDVAAALGSMITGQFNGQVFAKLNYNENLANNNDTYDFTNSIGSSAINSLNLDEVYVLTTSNTASASEMVINSLKAYLNDGVVVVGDFTTGKSQASSVVYDSPQLFNTDGVNPRHTYALLPLIAITVNKDDEQVPANGLTPDIQITERGRSLGTLGDVNEPLLAAALADIQGLGRMAQPTIDEKAKPLKNKVDKKITEDLMFVDIENTSFPRLQLH
uniref:S41 family peptidase n=1 Tax=Gelidibacter sp. TaxID=2018083 RepID=UPI00404B02C1